MLVISMAPGREVELTTESGEVISVRFLRKKKNSTSIIMGFEAPLSVNIKRKKKDEPKRDDN